jgi:HEAT repeat protein
MGDDELDAIGVDELVRAALALDDDDPDEDEHYWVLVAELQARGDRETFEAMRSLIGSGVEDAQILGATVLGQLGYTEGRPFAAESVRLVAPLAAAGGSVDLVTSAVSALGLIGDPAGAPAVLAQTGHPDEEARLGVAMSLPGVAGSPPSDAVVAGLIGLTRDPSGWVRDWATFGLGSQLDSDGAEVRAALRARVGDDEGAWDEALVGLARRRVPEAAELVGERLAVTGAEADSLVIEAAARVGDARLLPALRALKEAGYEDEVWLDRAISACEAGRPVAVSEEPAPRTR